MGNTIVLDSINVKHESAIQKENFDRDFGQPAGWQFSGLSDLGVAFFSFSDSLDLGFPGIWKIQIGMDQMIDTLQLGCVHGGSVYQERPFWHAQGPGQSRYRLKGGAFPFAVFDRANGGLAHS